MCYRPTSDKTVQVSAELRVDLALTERRRHQPRSIQALPALIFKHLPEPRTGQEEEAHVLNNHLVRQRSVLA